MGGAGWRGRDRDVRHRLIAQVGGVKGKLRTKKAQTKTNANTNQVQDKYKDKDNYRDKYKHRQITLVVAEDI